MKGIDPDQVFSSIPYTKGRLFLSCLEHAVGREVFDEFIYKYITQYSFQSLITEEFMELLERELPAAAERVDITTWLYRPGFPTDIPAITSKLYDDVKAGLSAYEQGMLPTQEEIQNWHYRQRTMFLDLLPKKIPPQHCCYFENLFGLQLQQSRNADLLMLFYRLCIRSDYQEILPGIEKFVARVGRYACLRPVFRAMLENDWTRSLARPMFEGVREWHHPITVAVIDNLLTQAGV